MSQPCLHCQYAQASSSYLHCLHPEASPLLSLLSVDSSIPIAIFTVYACIHTVPTAYAPQQEVPASEATVAWSLDPVIQQATRFAGGHAAAPIASDSRKSLTQQGRSCNQILGSSIPLRVQLYESQQIHVYRWLCRMAEGLYTDEEDEAEASPAASGAYSHSSNTDAHEHQQTPTQLQPRPQVGQRLPEPKRQDAAASRDLEREIAQALAADAAFLEDPSMTLREGALQPLEAGQEEGGYELPALSAGGTISKVRSSAWQSPLVPCPKACTVLPLLL